MKMIQDLGCIYPTEKSKNKNHYAIYECPECGKHFRCSVHNEVSGKTHSCGCMKYRWISERESVHGKTGTRLYLTWKNMKQRCSNNNRHDYVYYGGRGISVCAEWVNDFQLFYDWSMAHGYSDGLTLDRKNNDLNYTPDNCEWITFDENKRKRTIYKSNTSGFKGVSLSRGRWIARIQCNSTRIQVGAFLSAVEAAMAYNKYVIEHGTNHLLNAIPNE